MGLFNFRISVQSLCGSSLTVGIWDKERIYSSGSLYIRGVEVGLDFYRRDLYCLQSKEVLLEETI